MQTKDIAKQMDKLNNKIGVLVDDGPENTDQILSLNDEMKVLSDALLSNMNNFLDEIEEMKDKLGL